MTAKLCRIELINRGNFVVWVAAEHYLLEAIEAAGLRLPVGCRYGACITCAARLIEGEIDQSEAIALKPAQAAQGYVLLCIARPRSDCRFEVGLETQSKLYLNPFRGH
jgi:ferredoxin